MLSVPLFLGRDGKRGREAVSSGRPWPPADRPLALLEGRPVPSPPVPRVTAQQVRRVAPAAQEALEKRRFSGSKQNYGRCSDPCVNREDCVKAHGEAGMRSQGGNPPCQLLSSFSPSLSASLWTPQLALPVAHLPYSQTPSPSRSRPGWATFFRALSCG